MASGTTSGPGMERQALKARLNQLVRGELMTGGLPGQSLKWQEDVFKPLLQSATLRAARRLDFLDTSVEMRDANGVVLKDYAGNPRFYSMSEYFKPRNQSTARSSSRRRPTRKLDRERKEMARPATRSNH